ncbi:DUF559 domain-containing protein [Acinetobacter sp. 18QD2AZ41W]|uniref:endonuclease domain-containing protein n=1 Tax=Acinetobacter sp. 18QD2AZ41W TaxID=2692137 RepID=UPI001359D5F3|nr:DUF559 domain-containing protein [Acinetobacter sp. 18QD2AZ41W]
MNKKLDPQLLAFAKSMRHTATDAEYLMWQVLRAKRFINLKFRRQHVIAPYIVDFYCHDIGLVIELDGGQHGTDDAKEYDVERTKFLEALGLKLVRYWSHDVLGKTDVVLEDLWQVCTELKLKNVKVPSPSGRGLG